MPARSPAPSSSPGAASGAAAPGADATLPDPLPPSYEAALQELESLVARLDAGQLPLDELLVQYRRGAALLAFCRERLQAVEQQVQIMDQGERRPWTDPGAA